MFTTHTRDMKRLRCAQKINRCAHGSRQLSQLLPKISCLVTSHAQLLRHASQPSQKQTRNRQNRDAAYIHLVLRLLVLRLLLLALPSVPPAARCCCYCSDDLTRLFSYVGGDRFRFFFFLGTPGWCFCSCCLALLWKACCWYFR